MDNKLIKDQFFQMLRKRKVELKISELYPEKEMRCPVHLSIGQEAVAVGVFSALQRKDIALSAHRSHAHYLAKDEILESVKECWKRIKENNTFYKYSHQQKLFWQVLLNAKVVTGAYPHNLKALHKWKHPSARMGERWMKNRSNYFVSKQEIRRKEIFYK